MRQVWTAALLMLCTTGAVSQSAAPGAPPLSGETRGQAEVALQGYYLGGSQSFSSNSGLSIHFRDFGPKPGLLSGSLESYGADGHFRLGDNSLTLGGAVWAGRRWTITGGDFRFAANPIEIPFNNLVNSELSGRGVKIEASSKNR